VQVFWAYTYVECLSRKDTEVGPTFYGAALETKLGDNSCVMRTEYEIILATSDCNLKGVGWGGNRFRFGGSTDSRIKLVGNHMGET